MAPTISPKIATTMRNHTNDSSPMYLLVPTPAGILPMAPSGSPGNNSTKTGTPVWTNPPTTNGGNQNYKSFTSLYISKKFNQTKFSFLFFNDNFGKWRSDFKKLVTHCLKDKTRGRKVVELLKQASTATVTTQLLARGLRNTSCTASSR